MVVGDERFIYYIRDNVYGFAKIISHNSTERLIESPFENFVRAYKKLKDCLNEIFATCAVVVACDPVKISSPIKRNPHTRFIRRIFLFFVKKNRNRGIKPKSLDKCVTRCTQLCNRIYTCTRTERSRED